MNPTRHELQDLIFGNGQAGLDSQLRRTQNFLRGNAKTGLGASEQKAFAREEEGRLILFAKGEGLFCPFDLSEADFVSEGAEQRVYRFDDRHVVKFNGRVFYSCWLDYFNSLILHNRFFPSTAYGFMGFKSIRDRLHAVVKQEFIVATEPADLSGVKAFMAFNGFVNTRNHDYLNPELGIILEDLHDENVLSKNGIPFFIDTVFFLTDDFSLRG